MPAGDNADLTTPKFSAAKIKYTLDEIEKPLLLENGRPRSSTHRRQDLVDTQMWLLFGKDWRLTDTRLQAKIDTAAATFDGTNQATARDDDADLIQNIVEAVLKNRFGLHRKTACR